MTSRRSPARLLVAASALACLPSVLHAQAWGPPAGAGALTIGFQRIDHTGHRLTNGLYVDNGRSLSGALFLGADYGVTRRWSVSAGIPLVFAKYTDDDPPPPFIPFLPVDECRCWHEGWQDLSLTTRVMVVDTFDRVLAVTPSVSVTVPSHAYAYQGEAVIGRRLREFQLAVDAGRRLDEISRRLTVTGRYAYVVVQRILAVPNNRSHAELALEARVHPRVTVRGGLNWQRTHGGLRAGPVPGVDSPFGDVNTPERVAEHDRLLRDNRLHVTVGAAYHTARGTLFAEVRHFASGSDTHAGRALTVGITLPFRLRR